MFTFTFLINYVGFVSNFETRFHSDPHYLPSYDGITVYKDVKQKNEKIAPIVCLDIIKFYYFCLLVIVF